MELKKIREKVKSFINGITKERFTKWIDFDKKRERATTIEAYIVEMMDSVTRTIPNIRLNYFLIDNCHIIDVVPKEIYDENDEFQEIESHIYCEIFVLFPYEGFYFVGDKGFIQSEAIYSKKGKEYQVNNKVER